MENNILETRRNHLGSSDAKLVYLAGENGTISKSLKTRLAQLMGIIDSPKITTKEMQLGIDYEDKLYELLKEFYRFDINHNPIYYLEEITPKNFRIINHIDIEIKNTRTNELVWIECKATKTHSSINDVEKEYKYQLAWHLWLLHEKARKESLNPLLELYWAHLIDDQLEKWEVKNICIDDEYTYIIDTIKKGIEVIDKELDNFVFEMEEEVDIDFLPTTLQVLSKNISSYLKKIESLNKEVDTFKSILKEYMKNNNIKKISSDDITITLIYETESAQLDSKLVRNKYPDIYNECLKKVKKDAYVVIKTK